MFFIDNGTELPKHKEEKMRRFVLVMTKMIGDGLVELATFTIQNAEESENTRGKALGRENFSEFFEMNRTALMTNIEKSCGKKNGKSSLIPVSLSENLEPIFFKSAGVETEKKARRLINLVVSSEFVDFAQNGSPNLRFPPEV